MAKIKLEKEKKKATIGVDAPKDRVKLKQKMKKTKVPKLAQALGDDENPEEIPIQKVDQQPTLSKKQKKKDGKKNKNKSDTSKPGAILKIKPDTIEDELVRKQVKMTKNLKQLKKQIRVKSKNEPEVEAAAPEILATTDAIRAAVIAVRKSTEEEAKEKKKLFDKDFRYGLQVCYTKIPRVPTKQIRLPMPHSLYDDTDNICLIVRDNVRGKKVDYELTTAAYEKIFREQKIDFIKKVMPLQELKQNYSNFEMKRKLEQTYDLFLADAIISGMAFHILGKNLISKRKAPIPVMIKGVDESKLKAQLQTAISKTVYKRAAAGPVTTIPIATHKFTVEQFVENIEAIISELKTAWPGGWVNIKNIYLRTMHNSQVSLPLYISDINSNMVKTPVIIGPKQLRVMKMAKKLEEESKFTFDDKFQIEKKKSKKRSLEKVRDEGEKKAKKIKKEHKEDENGKVDDTEALDEIKSEGEENADEVPVKPKQKKKNKAKKQLEKTDKKTDVANNIQTKKVGKKNLMKPKK